MWCALFSGQGSQHLGMGRFLFDNFLSTRRLFEEASDSLKINMEKLCFEGPESELTKTENTQPSLLLVSYSLFAAANESFGFKAQLGAGHSLGEYSALSAARAIPFSQALTTVRKRGEEMQKAVPFGQGAMAAVLGISDDEVEKLCHWVNQIKVGVLVPANYNSPGQVVISGHSTALEWLKQNLDIEKAGISKKPKLIPLNVSAPFHSPLMEPAQSKMAQVIESLHWSAPDFTIVQNTTATGTQNAQILKEQLVLQISAPVKWTQSIRELSRMGATRYVEFGPGKVLTGLVKKIADSVDSTQWVTFNIQNLEDFKSLESAYKAK